MLQETEFWCQRPEAYQNVSVEEWLNISAPLNTDGSFDLCNIFDLDYSLEGLERPDDTIHVNVTACSSWEYDTTEFQVIK